MWHHCQNVLHKRSYVMGGFSSIWHWVILGTVLLLLFGRGKFSDMMGDVAKGIKSFKKGMAEEESSATHMPSQQAAPPPVAPPPTRIDATAQGGTVIEGEATTSSETKI
jgi:sec-independent protein translocase protein TatA